MPRDIHMLARPQAIHPIDPTREEGHKQYQARTVDVYLLANLGGVTSLVSEQYIGFHVLQLLFALWTIVLPIYLSNAIVGNSRWYGITQQTRRYSINNVYIINTMLFLTRMLG